MHQRLIWRKRVAKEDDLVGLGRRESDRRLGTPVGVTAAPYPVAVLPCAPSKHEGPKGLIS